MDNEGDKRKEIRDTLSSDSDLSKPIWVRHSSLQVKPINQRLLEYNAYYVCICTPILWLISLFF